MALSTVKQTTKSQETNPELGGHTLGPGGSPNPPFPPKSLRPEGQLVLWAGCRARASPSRSPPEPPWDGDKASSWGRGRSAEVSGLCPSQSFVLLHDEEQLCPTEDAPSLLEDLPPWCSDNSLGAGERG